MVLIEGSILGRNGFLPGWVGKGPPWDWKQYCVGHTWRVLEFELSLLGKWRELRYSTTHLFRSVTRHGGSPISSTPVSTNTLSLSLASSKVRYNPIVEIFHCKIGLGRYSCRCFCLSPSLSNVEAFPSWLTCMESKFAKTINVLQPSCNIRPRRRRTFLSNTGFLKHEDPRLHCCESPKWTSSKIAISELSSLRQLVDKSLRTPSF